MGTVLLLYFQHHSSSFSEVQLEELVVPPGKIRACVKGTDWQFVCTSPVAVAERVLFL